MQEQVRDAAVQLERFTAKELADHLGCKPAQVREHIDALVMRGIVDWAGFASNGKRGRPANVFAYIPIPAEKVKRRRLTPVEVEVAQRGDSEAPTGVGVKRRRRLRNADVRELAEAARAAGLDVKVDKHVEFIVNGRIITSTSKNPSDHRALKNARAALRSHGVRV